MQRPVVTVAGGTGRVPSQTPPRAPRRPSVARPQFPWGRLSFLPLLYKVLCTLRKQRQRAAPFPAWAPVPSLRGAPLSSPVPRDGCPSIGLSFSMRRPCSRAVEGRASWGRGSLKLLSVCCISLQVSHHPKPSGSPSLNHLAVLWSPPADGLGRAGPGSGAGEQVHRCAGV